tara:strand:+ start:2562 stop:3425 length:864 start_codon:yes stop_codon:yes gene_type:complete
MLDANTFTNDIVINYISKYFIPLKINAETTYGKNLFTECNGTGYPLIIFFDKNKNELDRFYGYYPPEEFKLKLGNVVNGENTFPALLTKYKLGDQSSETVFKLASKYFDRGDDSLATTMYNEVIKHSNVSFQIFHQSKFSLARIALKDNYLLLEKYILEYPDTPHLYEAVNYLLQYFNKNNFEEMELKYYNKYIEKFSNDPWFLNQYSWRMTELNINLDLALQKINLSLELIDKDIKDKAMILDTKAEIYWKLGEVNKAILVINNAIALDPENPYYENQKNKFLESI